MRSRRILSGGSSNKFHVSGQSHYMTAGVTFPPLITTACQALCLEEVFYWRPIRSDLMIFFNGLCQGDS